MNDYLLETGVKTGEVAEVFDDPSEIETGEIVFRMDFFENEYICSVRRSYNRKFFNFDN